MVSKFKFVRYGHIKKKLALYVLGLILTALGSRESPIFKILILTDFQALDPNCS